MTDICKMMQRATEHHKAGRFDQAERLYQHALKNEPTNPTALHGMALIAYRSAQYERAADLTEKAIASNGQVARFHSTYGIVLNALGRFEEAVAAYQRTLELLPDFPDARYNMGNSLGRLGRYDAAVEQYRGALLLKPGDAFAHFNMGIALQKLKRHEEAIEEFLTVVKLGHDPAEAYRVMAASRNALAQYNQTILLYKKALELKPDCPDIHSNLGMALLQTGNYLQGWTQYSWRLRKVSWMQSYRDVPLWDGSDFRGKRLLVRSEQGFGDNIQFVRYLPMVKARGGTVILATYKQLSELMRTASGIDQVVSENESVFFDLYCPLLELPRIFGTTLETIPAEVPYLYADPTKAAQWRAMLPNDSLRVGIVWGASSLDKQAQTRSCRLIDFLQLARIPYVRLYSLQKGQPAEQMAELSENCHIVNLGQHFNDFTDTAAAIENMDLIISVDTSVLHLAGALGKPVWGLTLFSPDWRWMSYGQNNPWYPNIRLFRQNKVDCWDAVFKRVAEELQYLVRQKLSGTVTKQLYRTADPKS